MKRIEHACIECRASGSLLILELRHALSKTITVFCEHCHTTYDSHRNGVGELLWLYNQALINANGQAKAYTHDDALAVVSFEQLLDTSLVVSRESWTEKGVTFLEIPHPGLLTAYALAALRQKFPRILDFRIHLSRKVGILFLSSSTNQLEDILEIHWGEKGKWILKPLDTGAHIQGKVLQWLLLFVQAVFDVGLSPQGISQLPYAAQVPTKIKWLREVLEERLVCQIAPFFDLNGHYKCRHQATQLLTEEISSLESLAFAKSVQHDALRVDDSCVTVDKNWAQRVKECVVNSPNTVTNKTSGKIVSEKSIEEVVYA